MVFRCLLKSNNDRATRIAKKTATAAINVFKGIEIGLPVELVVVGVEVGAVVGFDDEVGFGVEVEVDPSSIVNVWVGLQPLGL